MPYMIITVGNEAKPKEFCLICAGTPIDPILARTLATVVLRTALALLPIGTWQLPFCDPCLRIIAKESN